MSHGHRYMPEAQADLLAAVRYYEQQESGLGGEFLDEVESAVSDACEHPHRWPSFKRGVRKRSTRRFPYAVLYTLREDVVLILAIADMRRGPRWFKDWLRGWT